MSHFISTYIDRINHRYRLGNATEHTFRGDLAQLIESIVPDITATNEPKRQSCGAPDYILTKKNIPIGFIEAKDIGDKDLDGLKKTGNKEQFDRYKASLNNLIFTDYLNFHIYQDGVFITKIAIAEVTGNHIRALPENFTVFENLIKNFCTHIGQTIKSPKKLAEMMAAKARLLSDVIEKALTSDEDSFEDSTLKDQKQAFKQILIHDITPKGFADVYAQTIAYGMFAARLHDPTLATFNRQEAAELIPKTNPFLRKLFGYIAGPDIDDRIKWIVDSLVDVFLHCNVHEILKNYGRSTKMEDPIIHFYETFLSEYDPKLRKARGVWYTPAPVVNFIVRAVDDILKTEFGLSQGLADTSKTTIEVEATGTAITKGKAKGKRITETKEVHKVQILDPATGTGTFLAEVVKHIHQKFAGQQGIWSNYVEQHLLPRLNGFELLMASYAMAHLQLDLLLSDTGYKPQKAQRLRVYLTNSLEESHPDTGTLFANWLSSEANEANHIKRDTPVMCILGNPPYSVSSTNKGEWIQNLIADYKKDLNERKINLDDDYIKFIRYGQYFIEKNGEGVLAYISNNSFIDGITHRQMRKNLLETFDKIYIIDLHGNTKKKETTPDGHKDENVFDIMQGVSINIFVKTAKTTKLGKVFHYDVYGKREDKYDFLKNNALPNIKFKKLNYDMENYFFVPKNFSDDDKYKKGFKMDELFNYFNSGLQTKNDIFTIQHNINDIKEIISDLKNISESSLKEKYSLPPDRPSWNISSAKEDVMTNFGQVFKIHFKPFDIRYSYYTGKSSGFLGRPRKELTDNLLQPDNIALATLRQIAGTKQTCVVMLTKTVMTDRAMYSTNGTPYLFPLYLYNDNIQSDLEEQPIRSPNLNREIVDKIAKTISLTFTDEKENINGTFAPIDLLDYIYAVLHSPKYRETYKEFLKIDFPRVPYPKDAKTFLELGKLGAELRKLHLLESPKVEQYITQYPIDGDNIVEKPIYKHGNVYINDTQYFANVPEVAWTFYIGGYQPAQKWLKDRKDRALDFEDILHYQKIIVALTETNRIMQEIDTVLVEI
ncbi:type ISP restriction/modification enzyme [Acinetobacter junii]|uniref:type ISP restriction/modification enzyme n=4 Tax=Acinetobacter junii TaxID=40215 RepID=UPI0009509664|nr:type ISP restriction/modification enzyme [Acinetobacter junii]APU47681.1 DNA methyltransferase [Acinetobacter junii]MCU4408282.1 N-6 DNA methylase [Acinetobacter junii]MDH0667167.1 N-6 DNA methylase [Acinetobacter junii]MEB8379921.1 N-6 DNA methylase [Acinetobacter junii]TID64260.1 DNA methyltransferase [Acinetobacter junii]